VARGLVPDLHRAPRERNLGGVPNSCSTIKIISTLLSNA
jgi:hypothetical protein